MNSLEADVDLFPSSLCRLRADRGKWDLAVVTPGPDRRYNPDVLRLNRFDFPLIREKFLEAFRKMEGLCRVSPESRVSTEVKGSALTFKVETDGQGGGSVVVMLGGFRPALAVRAAEQFEAFVAALDEVERQGEELSRKALELDRLEGDAPAVDLGKEGHTPAADPGKEGGEARPLKVRLGSVAAYAHMNAMLDLYGHVTVQDFGEADVFVADEIDDRMRAIVGSAGRARCMTTEEFLGSLKER